MQAHTQRLSRSLVGSMLALALVTSGAVAETPANSIRCKRGKRVAECIETPEAENARRPGITATQSNLSRSAPVAMPSDDASARPLAKGLRDRQ